MTARTLPTVPTDVPGDIARLKAELRRRIGDVTGVFDALTATITARVEEVEALRAAGDPVWPILDYADIEAGRVGDEHLDAIRRRGCLVVRGHFDHDQALAWDSDVVDYLDRNGFDEKYRGAGDDFFGTLGATASRPEIYPIYWSRAQMEARQHPRMAAVQSFLNHRWTYETDGTTWFDPDQDAMYPDRIRRRPPGTDSGGLGAHTDSGALERWLLPAYQQVFASVFAGHPESYDPWNAAHRPEVDEYEGGTTMCSMFRTFQGWTALSDMRNDQGVLNVVPIPEAMAYVLLRPLLDDVPDDELCGVRPRHVLPVTEQWHSLLLRAKTPIPDVRAGDSVWWHCDMIHAVDPVTDQQGWGNVMYVPAAPMCEKNASYAARVAQDFLAGRSPSDFPQEDYEADWPDRFHADDLNEIGRRALGLAG